MAQDAKTATELPNRSAALVFWFKASLLKLRRALVDRAQRIKRYPKSDLATICVLAESRTALWTEAAESEIALQRDKVHNLRIAIQAIDRIVVPGGHDFSFWKQIGRCRKAQGYVVGRQLREGCIYPELGGGLCQLSNALYDVAEKAGLEITERHPHSHVIPGSAAERGRDATVSWNYIDLRFRSATEFGIEAKLTESELVVRILGPNSLKKPAQALQLTKFDRGVLDLEHHSCATCGEAGCFRHAQGKAVSAVQVRRTAFVVDEKWPEFEAYLRSARTSEDMLLIPLDGEKLKRPRYVWDSEGFTAVGDAKWETLRRAYASRKLAGYGAKRLESQLRASEAIARRLAKYLDADTLHLCVSQNFLPFLWRDGHLGGRSFEVLMTRLPLYALHERLDAAAGRWPERKTLSEFRAPNDVVGWEREALAAARTVVTPNREIAALFGKRAKLLKWQMPKAAKWRPGAAIVFPGPTAARKGAFEVREVARKLDLEVVLLGSDLEGDDFWEGVRTRHMKPNENWLDGAAMLVQPALVEERPRAILQALASGMPIVSTPHCGVEIDRVVQFGDPEALGRAIRTRY